MTVNVEAEAQLAKLLERVEAGEEVVVARDGVPVARVVLVSPPERTPGRIKGRVPESFFEPLSEEELSLWE